jgi:hypothetical protein
MEGKYYITGIDGITAKGVIKFKGDFYEAQYYISKSNRLQESKDEIADLIPNLRFYEINEATIKMVMTNDPEIREMAHIKITKDQQKYKIAKNAIGCKLMKCN